MYSIQLILCPGGDLSNDMIDNVHRL